jgi:hypothetical protein
MQSGKSSEKAVYTRKERTTFRESVKLSLREYSGERAVGEEGPHPDYSNKRASIWGYLCISWPQRGRMHCGENQQESLLGSLRTNSPPAQPGERKISKASEIKTAAPLFHIIVGNPSCEAGLSHLLPSLPPSLSPSLPPCLSW